MNLAIFLVVLSLIPCQHGDTGTQGTSIGTPAWHQALEQVDRLADATAALCWHGERNRHQGTLKSCSRVLGYQELVRRLILEMRQVEIETGDKRWYGEVCMWVVWTRGRIIKEMNRTGDQIDDHTTRLLYSRSAFAFGHE